MMRTELPSVLTLREREVLGLMAEGRTDTAISEQLS
jgi:DNA-binding CsgD family transcriptional regulator